MLKIQEYELLEPVRDGGTQKQGKVWQEVLYNSNRDWFLKCPWKQKYVHSCPGDKIQVHGVYFERNNGYRLFIVEWLALGMLRAIAVNEHKKQSLFLWICVNHLLD